VFPAHPKSISSFVGTDTAVEDEDLNYATAKMSEHQLAIVKNNGTFDEASFAWFNKSLNMLDYISPEKETAIILNQHLCAASFLSSMFTSKSSPFLLIIIHSAVKNFQERKAIRETWLSMEFTNWTVPFTVRSAFFLARTMNESLQNEVFDENENNGDIIQDGGFIDSFQNG